MALINTSVPNLIQGVSQQPDATRFAGQCEEQENALSSVADGLKKRPNTRHIARLLTTAIDSNSFVHFINRSDSEKYVLIHDGTKIQAWNMVTGNESSIQVGTNIYKSSWTTSEVTAHNTANPPNSTTYVATGYVPPSGNYLNSTTPSALFKGLTVADNTFLLNTSKGIGLDTTKTDPIDKEALVVINQGDYEKKYQVTVNINPTGSSNFTGATATAVLESFATGASTTTGGGFGSGGSYETTHEYRWRIVNVNVNAGSAGLGYLSANISFSSTLQTYTNAVYSASIDQSDGSISTIDLSGTRGEYEGSGRVFTHTTTTGTFMRGTTTDHYSEGLTPPSITVVITPNSSLSSGQAVTVSSFIYSGTGASSGANTDSIAGWLSSNSSNSGVNATTDRPMNVADTAGNAMDDYFTVSKSGSIIKLTKKTNWDGDFTISTEDSLGDTGMTALYKEVGSISDLPVKCYNGFKIKIIGDADLSQDDYYVEFQTNDGSAIGNGSWVETVGFDIEKGFNSSTMPFTLINDDEDTFVLSEINFAKRSAGDNLSNPNPSFVGSRITNIFFFKNRLGFLSEDNVIFSEAGLGAEDAAGAFAFNFYRTTVSSLLDSAPIDVSVSSRRVTTLEAAVGFQENLVLFSRNGQFVLKGGDLLTPKTVSITPITNFDYDSNVSPLPLGSYIYYPFKRGIFTGMREFTVNASTENYDSEEITEHVPAYIPSNIKQMKGTTSEDIIAVVSGEENNAIYIYNYFWNNNQKVLSAWSKFTFTGEIRGIEFIESTLYAVITNNGETNLVEMPLESGLSDAAGFVTHLDMRVAKTVTHGTSTITLPYTPADNSVEVYTTDGLKLNATNSGTTVTLAQAVNDVDTDGNDIDTPVFVGIPYTMKYTFSEQLFKAKAGQGTSPSNAAKLLIRNGSIYFDKTAFFKVKVTPKFRDTYENIFTPDVVGSTTIGTLNLDSGFYRFPVLTKAQDTTITIENGSALPSNFQSAEFESFVHSRSNRYG